MSTASKETALALSRIRAALTHLQYADSLGTLTPDLRRLLNWLRGDVRSAEKTAQRLTFSINQADAARRAKRARAA